MPWSGSPALLRSTRIKMRVCGVHLAHGIKPPASYAHRSSVDPQADRRSWHLSELVRLAAVAPASKGLSLSRSR